jgi:hypothetical protein
MIPSLTNSVGSVTGQLRWGWSGVSKLTRRDKELHIEHVVAMLPATKSGSAEVVAQLVEVCARFWGRLHQDEFGPGRGD